jgi:hypothetical protein
VAAISRDGTSYRVLVAPHNVGEIFWIELYREICGTNKVAEKNGQLPQTAYEERDLG